MANNKQIAYDFLYKSIITYDLQPGQPIIEQKVSETLGMSRTPIREALKQLESEGLVRYVHGKGTFASEITVQDVEEIFELRVMLEVLALQTAINAISDKDIDAAEKLLMSLDSHCKPEDFYKSDRAIHDLIVGNGGNSRLKAFLKNLNAQIEWIRRISSLRADRLSKSKMEHMDLLQALRQRDLITAELLLREHINNVKQSAIEVCRNIRI